MKQLKRLASILLVLGMVLGLMPLSAFAAEPANTAENTFTVTEQDNGGVDTYTFMLLDDGTVELTNFSTTAAAANVEIPSTATSDGKEYSVTSIRDGAFADRNQLKTVKLPDSIIAIGAGAFANCSHLTTVNLGNSVRLIDVNTFVFCTSLESVTLPDSVFSIENDAFAHCSKLTTVNLGNSVDSIGERAFADCTILESVTIPSSVRTIEENAFSFGDRSEKEKLEKLYYTGTQEQWDELAEKNDFKSKNTLLTNPQNFYCAHTVSFDYGSQANGTGKVVQEVVKYEGTVSRPADPEAKGYRFEGWYTQKNDGVEFKFDQKITKDVTVYAHWSKVDSNPKPNPDAKEYTLTEKDGTLVRVTVVENGTTVDITEKVVLEQQGTTQIGKIPAGAMVTVAANAAPEGMVFAQWNISDPELMGDPDVAHTSQTMTFPMPPKDVTIEAMYESAENARETELLGSAIIIGAVGISAVVLAYQAHRLGTKLYLESLLPSGAALPQNRIQLAELLWKNAGEPVPDGNAAYEDIGLNDEAAQQAAQWALENKLMELPDAEHTGQFKPDEKISYEEAIRAWKKAQQLKTAE